MPPVPCFHCGTNFMRASVDPEAPKLCNNCIVLEQRRVVPPKEKTNTIGIIIQCTPEMHAQVEEMCASQGMSYSQYFANLHEANIQSGWRVKGELSAPVETSNLPPIKFSEDLLKKGKKKKNVDG